MPNRGWAERKTAGQPPAGRRRTAGL